MDQLSDGSTIAGGRIGPYEVLERLGKGGMGEVYRAHDARLGRDVAIKILPPAFTTDPERLARFEREARILATLNHAHIGAIYGVEDLPPPPAEGARRRALVLELVEGPTLADRLLPGPLPVEEALQIARQIAEALEAAHEKGIIHRDLKPANIKIRPNGVVKVLDFGLAKEGNSRGSTAGLLDSPTITINGTGEGVILGTAAYMSPEQAKGLSVDRRADLWAFGAVLYEMLTGSRTFAGDSVSETIARILMKEPNWEALPRGTPSAIRRLLRRCLEKNPQRRFDSAAGARLEIEDALAPPTGDEASSSVVTRRRIALVAVPTLAGAAVIGTLITWTVMRDAASTPGLVSRFTIVPPSTQPLEFWGTRNIALSPDGRFLVYRSGGQLMLRALDRLTAEPLPGTMGAVSPFFSPDSRSIGFVATGDLKKVGVTGGPVTVLSRNLGQPRSATWGDDGTIVFSSEDPNIGLRRVSATGGAATALTTTDPTQNGHAMPSMLPGARGVLFTIWATAPEDRQLAVYDLESGQQKILLRGGAAGEYVDTGHLVYVASGGLFAVGFDLDRLEVRGEPVPIREALNGYDYAVSRTGTLAYVPPTASPRSLVWVDRKGHETPVKGLESRAYENLALSPDGTRVALYAADQESDVWIWDFAREKLTRLTFDRSDDWLPRWTPDGQRIVFISNRAGAYNLYHQAFDGSGPVERLTTGDNNQFPNSVTRDGTVLGSELRPNTGYDIVQFPAVHVSQGSGRAGASDGDRSQTATLISSTSAEFAANVSPDGRYFAYQSQESGGQFQIYVQPYPDLRQGRWQISSDGGVAPVWAPKGGELFYLDSSNTLTSVPVQTSGTSFSYGKPAKVFDTKYWGWFYAYDVTKDGRFLMMKETGAGAAPATITVVLNWLEELKARVGAGK